jgi:23S rRNA pseudouridine955/2504/2580 synthase
LHSDPDFLAINKPAGLACQGGRGVRHSVDGLAAAAFAGLPGLPGGSSQLRLVHRLDRGTSGALLLATSADAAAWLAAAFRGGTQPQPAAAAILKTYWAVVALPPGGGSGSLQLSRAGTLSLPVPSGKGGGEAAALTRYRLLHAGGGLAWLELRPQTGRKHQLRLHCARGLGAPIVGDERYGEVRSPAQAAALAEAAAAAAGAGVAGSGGGDGGSSPPLFLHCRRLVVRRPGAAASEVAVTAPPPPAWRALLARQGWPQPDGA